MTWAAIDDVRMHIPQKRFIKSNADRSIDRLVHGLHSRGFEMDSDPVIYHMDSPSLGWSDEDGVHKMTVSLHQWKSSIPSQYSPWDDVEHLIQDAPSLFTSGPGYALRAGLHLDDQIIHMEYLKADSYHVVLGLSSSMSDLPVFGDELPFSYNNVGIAFPKGHAKGHLRVISGKRVPAGAVAPIPRSLARGKATTDGVEIHVSLYLRDRSPSGFLDCYEVEIREGEQRFSDQTQAYVAESIWQEGQSHYCMHVDDPEDSYPFMPVETSLLSAANIRVRYDGQDPKFLSRYLSDVPFSYSGQNEWYASGNSNAGTLFILHKPDWGEQNTALTYEKYGQNRITSKQVFEAAREMVHVKQHLEAL